MLVKSSIRRQNKFEWTEMFGRKAYDGGRVPRGRIKHFLDELLLQYGTQSTGDQVIYGD